MVIISTSFAPKSVLIRVISEKINVFTEWQPPR